MGTRETPIEVAAEVVPQEVPKPAEAKPKPGWKWPEPTNEVVVGQPGQWGAGPPRDKRRVVVDEGPVRRREGENGEDEPRTGVEQSTEGARVAERKAGEGQVLPTFEDM